MLTFMWFCSVVDFMLLMPLGAEFMDLYQIQPNQFSHLMAAYSIAAGVSSFAATFFIDKYDRKKILLSAFFLFGIGSIVCSYANTYELMLFARAFTGLFGGMLGCTTVAIISDIVPYSRRGKAMSYLNMAFGLASIIGIPLGLIITKYTNEFFPFRLVGILSFVALLLAIKIIPSLGHFVRDVKPLSLKEILELLKDKNLSKAFLFTFLLIVGHFMYITFINPFLQENLAFTIDQTTVMYVFGGFFVVATSTLFGKYIDHFGKLKSFVFLMLLLFVPLVALAHLKSSHLYLVLFLCTLLFVFSSGRMIAAMTLLTGAPTEQQRSKFLAIRSSIIEFSEGISVSIGGFILSRNEITGHIEHFEELSYVTVFVGLLSIYIATKLKINEAKEELV